MTKTVNPGIGTITYTAIPQPKIGDRDDFLLQVNGPDPSTNFNVPISITGTVNAIWDRPSPIETAEALGAAVFHQLGTASIPPREGFWFDSYNSGGTINETINKIYNSGVSSFIKNYDGALYVRLLGNETNKAILDLDKEFSKKFNLPFFKSLEDISEESQRSDDLNTPAKSNADYLYRICILSGIIDHIAVKLNNEDTHLCSACGKQHYPHEGSLNNFRNWLENKLEKDKVDKLIKTFQMIKKLRKQYPIHDHFTSANNIRSVRKEIEDANKYFGIVLNDSGHNASLVIDKFTKSLNEIKETISELD